MMISFLGQFALNFYHHKYIIYILAVVMPFAVFILLIGMGLGNSQDYVN